MKAVRRKRIFLVNRDFQLKYALSAVLVGTVTTVFTFAMLILPLYIFEIIKIAKFLPLPILATIFLASFINIATVGMAGIFLTHRIAGPMYSLVRCLRKVEAGRWGTSLKLREGDDLKYVVRNFNEMTRSLEAAVAHDVTSLDEVLAMDLSDTVRSKLESCRAAIASRVEVDSAISSSPKLG